MAFEVAECTHHAEDEACRNCCCNYPYRCPCGGLIHAQVTEEVPMEDDCYYLHEYKCDKCGSPDKYAKEAGHA